MLLQAVLDGGGSVWCQSLLLPCRPLLFCNCPVQCTQCLVGDGTTALFSFQLPCAQVTEGKMDLLTTNEMKQLLDKKWQCFGKPCYLLRLLTLSSTLILWVLSCTVFDGLPVAKAACETAILLTSLWPVLCAVLREKQTSSRCISGTPATERMFERLFPAVFLAFLVCRYQGLQHLEYVAASAAAVIGWGRVFLLLVGSRSVGPFIIMIRSMIQFDVLRFLAVYMAILLGYTMAFYLTVGVCRSLCLPPPVTLPASRLSRGPGEERTHHHPQGSARCGMYPEAARKRRDPETSWSGFLTLTQGFFNNSAPPGVGGGTHPPLWTPLP